MFALMQVLSEDPTFADVVLEVIGELESSCSTQVQQQSYETRKLLSMPAQLREVLQGQCSEVACSYCSSSQRLLRG